MALSPTESSRTLLSAWPARVGLPAALLSGLPAIVALFAVDGHPAFGVAVLSALSGSQQAVARMRAFEGSVNDALRDLGFRMEPSREAPAGAALDRLAEQVRLLQGTLTPAQVDQLSLLFEEILRSTDADWHELLLRATRALVKDVLDEVACRAVLAPLSRLSPAVLRELQRMKDRPERPRGRPRARELTPVQVVLLSVGFVREGAAESSEGAVNVAAVRVPTLDPAAPGEMRPTTLGLAALRLFGPVDPGP